MIKSIFFGRILFGSGAPYCKGGGCTGSGCGGGAGCIGSASATVPQAGQNFAPSFSCAPQLLQNLAIIYFLS